MSGPPKDIKVGPLFAAIIARGRLPHATVDFPRYDEAGEPVCKVYLRPLTQAELITARANAAVYVARTLSGAADVKWKPDELEDNATAAEILAVACRDPEDPEKPFFPYGVVETRQCTTEELAILFAAYNGVREKSYPSLRELTEEQLWAWTRALESGAEEFPFSRVSRAKLEAYSAWAATYLVSLATQLTGTTSSSSPASPSAGSPTD